jgi:hypothetical protein
VARSLDAHHVGTQIAEDHCRMRAGADARQLNNAQTLQWSSHALSPLRVWVSVDR